MKTINEIGDTSKGQYMLGSVASRANNRASAANLGTKERRKQRVKAFDTTHKAESNRLAYNKGYFHKGWDDENNKNESKNLNKALIRLTESDLHRIVLESVNKILKEDVDYGIPPYTVVVGGMREGQPFDDIYEAIEYAEQWHSYITNSGEHENITIYDGNDEDVWSVGHFR